MKLLNMKAIPSKLLTRKQQPILHRMVEPLQAMEPILVAATPVVTIPAAVARLAVVVILATVATRLQDLKIQILKNQIHQ